MERAESQGHRGRDPAGQLTGSPVITTFAQRHRPCCPGRYWSARTATPQPPPRCGRSPACSPTHPVNVLPRSPSPRPTTCAPRHGARGTGHTLLDALQSPVEDQLAHLNAPTLVVRGGRDAIASQGWVEKVTTLLPHGHLAVIPDARTPRTTT